MPGRVKRKRRPKRRRKLPQKRRAGNSAKKLKLVVYEFRNPAVEGSFTVELPAGWQGGMKFPRGKQKPRR